MRQLTMLVLIIFMIVTGCTMRYSKSLVGSVAITKERPVTNESSGLGISAIVVDEPSSARNLSLNCESVMTQVDYRSHVFPVFLFTIFLPKVEVKTICSGK